MLLWALCSLAYPEVLAVAASGQRTPVIRMQTTSEVELDIFSGRPNPTWTLSEPASRRLIELLAALPAVAPRELSNNLGYRGLIVTMWQSKRCVTLRIQEGLVEIKRGARTEYHEDKGRALERWLIGTGQDHVSVDVRQVVQRALE